MCDELGRAQCAWAGAVQEGMQGRDALRCSVKLVLGNNGQIVLVPSVPRSHIEFYCKKGLFAEESGGASTLHQSSPATF